MEAVTAADLIAIANQQTSQVSGGATGDGLQLKAYKNPLLSQRAAYLGWLLTNPQFLRERDDIRQSRQQRNLRASFLTAWDQQVDHSFANFLRRWQISSLASWELPIPQGANMTGHQWPAEVSADQRLITLQLPTTATLPARYPVHRTLREAQLAAAPGHLREWIKILDKPQAGRFQNILYLYFYWDIVLAVRYANRFKGAIEDLDEVMSEFLFLGEEAIKKLRSLIRRRLADSAVSRERHFWTSSSRHGDYKRMRHLSIECLRHCR